ncbi:hypothetical protein SUDANB19_05237 [Streptomyces sp. enrichment culture]|nr:hypothetical protein TPA0909_67420 [Streptomyces albus]
MTLLKDTIDPAYDSIVTYTSRSPDLIETATLGTHLGGPGDIL